MSSSFAHISSCSKSACSFLWSFAVLIVLYSKQSSANSLIEDVTLSGRSFMWQRNSIGPKGTVPWGTPTVVSFDCSPSTIVRINLVVRKFVSHLWILPFIPYWCNLWRSTVCYVELCRKLVRNLILQRPIGVHVLCGVLVGSHLLSLEVVFHRSSLI